MSIELTGVIIAKNEAKDLPETLQAWRPLCRELILVDNNSNDATPDIALRHGAKVLEAGFGEEGYSGLRNTGLDVVETSHALVFDADERPTVELQKEILEIVAKGRNQVAYSILRSNFVFGRALLHGRFYPDWQIRLFPSSVRYVGIVHERPSISEDIEIQELTGTINHYTYTSILEYLSKMRTYARLSAQQGLPIPTWHDTYETMKKNGKHRAGYRDGWRGFLMVAGDAYHDYHMRKSST